MDTSYQSMFSTLMKRSHTNLFHTSDCKLKVSGLWSVVILLNKNGTFELSKFNLVLGSFSKKIFHIFLKTPPMDSFHSKCFLLVRPFNQNQIQHKFSLFNYKPIFCTNVHSYPTIKPLGKPLYPQNFLN